MKIYSLKNLGDRKLFWDRNDPNTQADTFIEWCFEQRCAGINQGAKILNEWRMEKERYCSYIQTTIFDFQHYSRHDESHSINILNAIAMALGRKRIKLLSAADLWGILESAYFHDIGMAFSHEELLDMWSSDEEFKNNIRKMQNGESRNLQEAAAYYKQICNKLQSKPQTSGLDDMNPSSFPDGWPIELQRYVILLTTEYIRKNHAVRSKKKMLEFFEKDDKVSAIHIIPDRLYKIVSEISCLHGKNFSDINKSLAYKEIGFDTESMHPQFIAALLRLGDLLDMDNNRFDLRALEHFGELPYESGLHYKKHKALEHFDITPRVIEARAVSKDKEVCRVTRQWFNWLEKDVENLICDWNRFAPKELQGCLLQRCRLEVYYGDTLFDAEQSENYRIDKKRLLRLLEGYNIYASPIDCLREYLQNALDASKMQLWLEIKKEKIKYKRVDAPKEVCPYDIEKRAFQDKTIEVGVLIDERKQDVTIRIQDQGIGMEKECIEGLSVVGRSWKQRAVFRDEIDTMPEWLKPTGGFGIGLQSAFMLTDEVIVHSKSEKEADGYEVHLFSPQHGGNVTKQKQDSIGKLGTTIQFKVKLQKLYELMGKMQELDIQTIQNAQGRHDEITFVFKRWKQNDCFTKEMNEEYLCSFLDYYIRKIIPNTLFPISICIDEKKNDKKKCDRKDYDEKEDNVTEVKRIYDTYRSPFASHDGGFGYSNPSSARLRFQDEYLLKLDDDTGEELYLYKMDQDMTVRIWDLKENTHVCVMSWPEILENLSFEAKALLNPMCYRNVRVAQLQPELSMAIPDFLSICIDTMGGRMEDVLSIHRDSFKEDFDAGNVIDRYIKAYIDIVIEEITLMDADESRRKMGIRENDNIDMMGFTLLAITMQQKKGIDALIAKWEMRREYAPRKILMKQIRDGALEDVWMETAEVFRQLADVFAVESNKKAENSYTIIADDFRVKREDVDSFSLRKNDFPLENARLQRLQNVLMKDNMKLYVFSPICNVLLKVTKNHEHDYIRILEDPENRVYLVVQNLGSNLKNAKENVISEKELLKNIIQIALEKRRYIGINISCKKYDKLKVDCLPGEKRNEITGAFNNSYLISPIGFNVFMQVLREIGIKEAELLEPSEESFDIKTGKYIIKNNFTKEDFGSLVKESPDFDFVVNWVLEHQMQKDKGRLGKEEIIELYSGMLEGVYKENFCKVSKREQGYT